MQIKYCMQDIYIILGVKEQKEIYRLLILFYFFEMLCPTDYHKTRRKPRENKPICFNSVKLGVYILNERVKHSSLEEPVTAKSSKVLQASSHRTGRKESTKQADFSEMPVNINRNTRCHIEEGVYPFKHSC
jgi:hypothetical protein